MMPIVIAWSIAALVMLFAWAFAHDPVLAMNAVAVPLIVWGWIARAQRVG